MSEEQKEKMAERLPLRRFTVQYEVSIYAESQGEAERFARKYRSEIASLGIVVYYTGIKSSPQETPL